MVRSCRRFEAKASTEQIVPVMDAIAHDRVGVFQVNIPNRGPLIPGTALWPRGLGGYKLCAGGVQWEL